SPPVPTAAPAYQSVEARFLAWTTNRLRRRSCAVAASGAFVAAGLIYFFWWGLHVDWGSPRHLNWNTGSDIWLTFLAAKQVAHGHLSDIYAQYHFASFPGIVFVL